MPLDEGFPLADSQSELDALREFFEASLEVDAALALIDALRAKGYEILGYPLSLSIDGEIDVAVPVRDASGRESWMVVEAKARLRASDIRQWARKLRQAAFRARLRAAGVREPIKAYAFGRMVYQDTDRAAREHGIGLLTPFGEIIGPA